MTPSFRFHSPKPKKARPEAHLQKAVCEHLRLRGTPDMLYFSIPNEGKRSPATCAELKRMGMRPGAADLCVVLNGRAHFMEIKTPKGKQSAEQLGFQDDCYMAFCDYEVVNNINDALRVLEAWNAIRPDARRAA